MPSLTSYGVQSSDPRWFMVLRLCERLVGSLLAVALFPLSWPLVFLCAASYAVRMVGVDAFYHRMIAHETYRVGRFTQFLLALVGTQAGQRGPLWWAYRHRMHHRYAETALDPHSPVVRSFRYAAIDWFVAPENLATDLDAIPEFARYPELRWLNRFYVIPLYTGGALLALAGSRGWFGPDIDGLSAFLWGFEVPLLLVVYITAGITSITHMRWLPGGYRRYDIEDQSVNRPLLGLISMGVGFHNNHHRLSTYARCGLAWWEIDISYYVIRGLQALGLASDVRSRIPPEILAEGGLGPVKQAGDVRG
jgi:stearoyl-CoA desaturase (delta-9 desaturase)